MPYSCPFAIGHHHDDGEAREDNSRGSPAVLLNSLWTWRLFHDHFEMMNALFVYDGIIYIYIYASTSVCIYNNTNSNEPNVREYIVSPLLWTGQC